MKINQLSLFILFIEIISIRKGTPENTSVIEKPTEREFGIKHQTLLFS